MNQEQDSRHRALLIAAFAVIYVVWGSTYLAIRIAVESLPPFLGAGARFVVAGGVMLAALAWRGLPMPDASQWRYALVTGTFMILGGNGLVMWAEQSVSSGFTALLVALVPVWFALLEWLRPGVAARLYRENGLASAPFWFRGFAGRAVRSTPNIVLTQLRL